MKLSQATLPDYFTIADSANSWYKEPTNTFDFVDNDSRTLLVTIGDSWTYGDKLPVRTEQVYGRLVADSIGADWLNLGLCAQGNFWIASMVEELVAVIPKLDYDKIYVICIFGGVGRWFNTEYDVYLNYVDWFNNNIHEPQDFDRLLPWLNDECVHRILTALEPFLNVQLKIGTHYLDPIGLDRLRSEQLLDTPWYRVIGCTANESVYTCVYWERISTAIEFINPEYHKWFKAWVVDIIDRTLRRVEMLKTPGKFVDYHPVPEGHRLWANYIVENL
jgi:hypothetical protein